MIIYVVEAKQRKRTFPLIINMDIYEEIHVATNREAANAASLTMDMDNHVEC